METKIDHFSYIPKYIQLQQILEEKIKNGKLNTGDSFYTEQQLMKTYSLSSATVARAMREMVKDGLITRKGEAEHLLHQNIKHLQ